MTQFDTIVNKVNGFLPSYQKTQAEEELEKKFDLNQVQQLIKQWSSLVVWSWLELTNYPQDYQNKPTPEEEYLRQDFIYQVKDLARLNMQEHYCPNMFTDIIKLRSQQISNYLIGKQPQTGLNLSALSQKITGQQDNIFNDFSKNCWWLISVDEFHGWLLDYKENQGKSVIVLAYPPCPAELSRSRL
ncbi:MAG: hypothetical protein F6K47_41520, partial [Symploca sp. SIO2E6]|nr:hypothetical protein [Symploca sp. SIO2E6]